MHKVTCTWNRAWSHHLCCNIIFGTQIVSKYVDWANTRVLFYFKCSDTFDLVITSHRHRVWESLKSELWHVRPYIWFVASWAWCLSRQANEAALIVSLQIDHHCLIIIMTVLTNYCFLCHQGGVLKRPSLFSKYQSKFKLNQKPEFGLWLSLKSYFILLQEDWSVCPSECRCTWSGGKRTAECQVRQNIERKIYCREKYIVEKNIL